MPTDPITAEDVIEAARGFLKATLNNAFDFDDARLYDEHEERLEDLLTHYDAQPKPRWLKPEEVREEGCYWTATRDGRGAWSNVRAPQSVFLKHGVGLFVNRGVGERPIEDYGRYRFYGPLPEPPPPEGVP